MTTPLQNPERIERKKESSPILSLLSILSKISTFFLSIMSVYVGGIAETCTPSPAPRRCPGVPGWARIRAAAPAGVPGAARLGKRAQARSTGAWDRRGDRALSYVASVAHCGFLRVDGGLCVP